MFVTSRKIRSYFVNVFLHFLRPLSATQAETPFPFVIRFVTARWIANVIRGTSVCLVIIFKSYTTTVSIINVTLWGRWWMNAYGLLVELCWWGKTEVIAKKKYISTLSTTSPHLLAWYWTPASELCDRHADRFNNLKFCINIGFSDELLLTASL